MKFLFSKTMAVLFLTAIFNGLQAQEIKGFVIDAFNVPIKEVSVFVEDEKIGETNTEGIFYIPAALSFPLKIRLEHTDFFIANLNFTQNNQVFKLLALSKSENLEEVIVASTYQKESKVIVPTSKILAEKFEEYSPVDLVSAINETPGVYIQSGALNTNRITIRGVGARTLYGTNKIRAYFNGIPITNGGGETAIDSYDPENLQTLEIVKGPKATQYGTNLGGTLLLTSKQAGVGESYIKSKLTIGSFQLIKNSVSAATSTDKFSLNLNYDHLETEGFRENSNYDRKSILLTINYRLNQKNEVSFLLNYTDYFAQIASSIGKTAFEENPSQAAFTWKAAQGFEDNKQTLAGLSFTHRFSEKFSNTSSIFYSYLDHYEPRPFNILDEFTNGYGGRTVFALNFKLLNKSADFSFGGEYYRDGYNWKTIENLYEENNGNGSLEGEVLSDNFERRNNLNAFATLSLPLTEKLKAQFGLNFNNTNYNFKDTFNSGEADKSAQRNFDPIFAPNVNLLYKFNESLSAYFNFSRGFNYPSIEETLTPAGIINPDLGPEKGFNYEVGSEIFFFKRKLYFQVAAYLLSIDDLLVADRVGEDEYIGRNAGKTEHKGIEFQTSYFQPLAKDFYISPFLNAEITDHNFIDFVDSENDYSGNQLTGVPALKVNGGINLGFDKFRLNTNFLHLGEMPMDDANSLFSDSYTVFNVKTSYSAQLTKTLKVDFNFGINNFTDKNYASSILINATGFGNSEPRFYYPGMPRNWFGGVRVEFRI